MNPHKSSEILENAVDRFASLPGVGRKTALKYVLHLLKKDPAQIEAFAQSIRSLHEGIKTCNICGNISDGEVCGICSDPRRDISTICVVENIKDVITLENTGQYSGVYHVLGNLISPMEGIGPSELRIEPLIRRCESERTKEIIFALSATIEGDTTAYYVYKKIGRREGLEISTLARGIAIGNGLEFTDELTLARSLVNLVAFG